MAWELDLALQEYLETKRESLFRDDATFFIQNPNDTASKIFYAWVAYVRSDGDALIGPVVEFMTTYFQNPGNAKELFDTYFSETASQRIDFPSTAGVAEPISNACETLFEANGELRADVDEAAVVGDTLRVVAPLVLEWFNQTYIYQFHIELDDLTRALAEEKQHQEMIDDLVDEELKRRQALAEDQELDNQILDELDRVLESAKQAEEEQPERQESEEYRRIRERSEARPAAIEELRNFGQSNLNEMNRLAMKTQLDEDELGANPGVIWVWSPLQNDERYVIIDPESHDMNAEWFSYAQEGATKGTIWINKKGTTFKPGEVTIAGLSDDEFAKAKAVIGQFSKKKVKRA